MNKEEIRSKIASALSELYAQDIDLINNKTKEETISAHLICHLKPLFYSWNVDVEYNRDGQSTKRNSERKKIFPDILIHHRTPNRDERFAPENNLVAIEVKGFWNTEDRNLDERKLIDMKTIYGYQYLFRIELGQECGEIVEVSTNNHHIER